MSPSLDWTPVDNSLRRNNFRLTQPSVRRAKMFYVRNGNLSQFESEIESALNRDDICTVCGKNSQANDGRCEEHISTSLAGDWPDSTHLFEQRLSKLKQKLE